MSKEYIAEGETVEQAVEIALNELGVGIEEVDYTVIDEPGKKMFGFGSSKNAKVSVTLKDRVSEGTDSTEAAVPSKSSAPSRRGGANRDSVDYSSLTDDEIDKIADTAIGVVTKIAELAGAVDFKIEEFEGEEGEIILDLVGGDLSFLIGRHGRTLDAIQTATSAIVTKQCGFRYPLSIDIEGYRHRRKQKVREIAESAAERAIRHGRPVPLRPMSPQERRLVHVAIRDMDGVMSTSEGNGDSRHVVVMVISEQA